MQLSKLESMAYETLKRENLAIFRAKDLILLLGIDRTKAYNLIKALKKKKAIETVKGGVYALQGSNELAIGSSLNWPSYISFWSALSYYGFSDQMPKTMFYATTRYRKKIKNYKYATLSKKRFFGYIKIGELVIAEKEKSIIDSLLLPKYSGGVREVISCFRSAMPELDKDKLAEYALKMESKSVLRRLGFILELIGCEERILKKIAKGIGKGYELLDPSLKKKNSLNKRWMLDINDDIDR